MSKEEEEGETPSGGSLGLWSFVCFGSSGPFGSFFILGFLWFIGTFGSWSFASLEYLVLWVCGGPSLQLRIQSVWIVFCILGN